MTRPIVLPSVVRAQYRGGYRIQLSFIDGVEATLDFRRWLKGPVFDSVKDLDTFRRFFLDGGTVAWPSGADIAPETLYAAAKRKRPRGRPTPEPVARTSRIRKRLYPP